MFRIPVYNRFQAGSAGAVGCLRLQAIVREIGKFSGQANENGPARATITQRTKLGAVAAPAAAPAAAPIGPATTAPKMPPTAAPPTRLLVVVHALLLTASIISARTAIAFIQPLKRTTGGQ